METFDPPSGRRRIAGRALVSCLAVLVAFSATGANAAPLTAPTHAPLAVEPATASTLYRIGDAASDPRAGSPDVAWTAVLVAPEATSENVTAVRVALPPAEGTVATFYSAPSVDPTGGDAGWTVTTPAPSGDNVTYTLSPGASVPCEGTWTTGDGAAAAACFRLDAPSG